MLSWNTLKTTVLLAALTALFVIIGGSLGGSNGMILGFVFAIVMNIGSYWFSDKIAMKMAGAKEVSYSEAPELHQLVDSIARTAGLPKPRVAMVNSSAPNAFATGRNPQNGLVAVTTGILEILDRRELTAVLAHEMGHIRNRDILISAIAATFAGAITVIAHMGQWAMIFGGYGRGSDSRGNALGGLLMLILAPIAAAIIQLAISRSREYGADRTGADVSGDPEALASALEKLEAYSKRRPLPVDPAVSHLFIVKPLTGTALQNIFSTHPPTAERVARLRQMALTRSSAGLNRIRM